MDLKIKKITKKTENISSIPVFSMVQQRPDYMKKGVKNEKNQSKKSRR